eukprot:12967295-Alexandrium_andersonii.AAC.1
MGGSALRCPVRALAGVGLPAIGLLAAAGFGWLGLPLAATCCLHRPLRSLGTPGPAVAAVAA